MIVPVPQFTAPAYNDRTSNNVQRMMNWFPEQTPDGWNLVSYPGYKFAATAPNDAQCRGAYYTSTGRLFTVHGNTVYEWAGGLAISVSATRGTISTSATNYGISFADNGIQLFIVINTENAYYLNLSSGAPTLISDSNFPTDPIGAAFSDGYFITAQNQTGLFYLSQLLDGSDWTPVQFATAEYAGDSLLRVVRMGSQVVFFGTRTIEPWYNTGNASFPFERVNGGIINIGVGSERSFVFNLDTAYFVSVGQAGQISVFEYGPGGLKRISTTYIESIMLACVAEHFDGYFYNYDGHGFYVLSNDGAGGRLAYDTKTGAWIETAASATGSNPITTIINEFYVLGSYPYAFSSIDGDVFTVEGNYNTNNGTAISRVRIFGPIKSNSKRVFHNQIRFELEIAFDATGTTSIAPTLDWSDDGGLTYSTAITMTKTVTNTTTGQRVVLTANRLGSSSERYYRLTGPSNAAKIILKKCELDLQEGRF